MRAFRRLFAVGCVVGLAFLLSASPAAAAPHALITGSGSSWSSNAISQWIADVHSRGLQVVFSPNGSAAGRQDFANKTVDFAVSDIGYQGTDPATGANDTPNGRQLAYLPIVAGGTALPYHIIKNGQLVRNLRLSAPTVAGIFSGKIKNWNDPAITKDNNGKPVVNSLPIIPVVHSEGSGSTYQFTRYLAKTVPQVWNSFSGVGATEYFPQGNSNAVRQSGSDGAINFISGGAGNGSIGYDEYSYALGKNYPVAKLLNSGGYYTLPNQYNVAVALTKAIIDNNPSSSTYLLQNLDNVYTASDSRVYPMSSYSYAIIPTASNDSKMTTAKRQTLADYLDYSVCQGQAEMGKVGYSPLPINLVQASFGQILKLKTADKGVDVSQVAVKNCNNPTFTAGNPKDNKLARVAPQPEACDKQGAGPCTDSGNTGQLNPDQGGAKTSRGGSSTATGSGSGNGTSSGTGSNTASGGTGTGTGGTGTGTGAGTGAVAANGAAAPAGTRVDPATGQLVGTGTGGTGGTGAAGGAGDNSGGTGNNQAVANATTLGDSQSPSTDIGLEILAGALLLALLALPPIVASRVRRGPR